MKTPRVVFKYSWVYDDLFKGKSKDVPAYIQSVKKLWRKDEKKVLTEMSKVSSLKWKSDKIICYVVSNCIPFSDPLTMSVFKEKDYFIDTLTHELIHRLFIDDNNLEKAKKSWNYFKGKYDGDKDLWIHIPLHAIHRHIYLKFYDEKRINRDKKKVSHLKSYSKSWKIVEREGHQNIIKEFKKRLK